MSRLPENPGYWEKLTDHLLVDARDQLRHYRSGSTRWWHVLARFSVPLTLAAGAAVIVALLRLPDTGRQAAERTSPAGVYGIMPTDPLAFVFVTATAAPTVATLFSTPTAERTQ